MFNRWKAHRFADRARELFDDTRDVAREKAADADTFIHERPIAATLLGVGLGLAMGMTYGSLRHSKATAAPQQGRAQTSRKSRRSSRG